MDKYQELLLILVNSDRFGVSPHLPLKLFQETIITAKYQLELNVICMAGMMCGLGIQFCYVCNYGETGDFIFSQLTDLPL